MKIQKRHLFIIFGIVLLGIGMQTFQYLKTFKEEVVSAVTIGTPNPGHTLSDLECSADSLCIDTTHNYVGIGNNNPAYKLDVDGDVNIVGKLFINGVEAIIPNPNNGVCGLSDGANLPYSPLSNLCKVGTPSPVSGSGPWTWSCVGINGATDSSCSTVYNLYSGVHTPAQCSAINGTITLAGDVLICQVNQTPSTAWDCPSGWTKFGWWSTTTSACSCLYPSGSGEESPCRTGGTNPHAWSNVRPYCCDCCNFGNCLSNAGYGLCPDLTKQRQFRPLISQIGCY